MDVATMEQVVRETGERNERIVKLMTQPGAYYDSCIRRAAELGVQYPEYRIQIDTNVKKIIFEYCEASPGYFPQDILDRFEEMEDGFGVHCYQAEEIEYRKKLKAVGVSLPSQNDIRRSQYMQDKANEIMFAKIAASNGEEISDDMKKAIKVFEDVYGDMLEYYKKVNPTALIEPITKYKEVLEKRLADELKARSSVAEAA